MRAPAGVTLAVTAHMAVPHQVIEERPRERLWSHGTHALGDEELIAILLGTGVRAHSVREVAAELVRTSGGVAAVSRASPREL
ncbi:MAG TPA: UPF0758 domain-containing protein, partial [Kofleriaceae bacterium]|nr:UPF0758 domain-containing protein [Kofleriaceae bacterium]